MTISKVPFFWDSKKAQRARRLFGDTITTALYLVIGGILTIVGVLLLTGTIAMK